ncbi:MAG: glutathione S-transferase family protein [Gammaproteobacteria bacterium]
MIKVYGDSQSGNCYKVKLVLTHLDKPFEWVEVSVLNKETRTPEFLAKNPNGKIPLVELERDVYMSESSAIMYYFAQGSDLLPEADLERARVLEWLFFEQYSHEPYIATSRFYLHYLKKPDEYKDLLEQKRGPGCAALDIMEKRLTTHEYLVGNRYSIADIGLYAYTHVADEGGFDLGEYPAIRAWLERVKSHPTHVPMV